jgi:hypothetical protein
MKSFIKKLKEPTNRVSIDKIYGGSDKKYKNVDLSKYSDIKLKLPKQKKVRILKKVVKRIKNG